MSGEEAPTPESVPEARTVLVDAHVHLHSIFDEARFFQAAVSNFAAAARVLRVEHHPWRGVLILTESAGSHRFASLGRRVGAPTEGGWRVEPTVEATSLRVRSEEGDGSVTVIAGRQVQTAEGLEVLAFPLLEPPPEGRPVRAVLRTVVEAGALGLVPWGFGKWWGSRGRLVRRLLEEGSVLPFLLADTGHRPAWAGRPEALTEAERQGRPTLTGSDPLPFRSEETRAGSCCFALSLVGAEERPATSIKEALAALEAPPPRYERRPGTVRFVATQVAMQLRKRLP